MENGGVGLIVGACTVAFVDGNNTPPEKRCKFRGLFQDALLKGCRHSTGFCPINIAKAKRS